MVCSLVGRARRGGNCGDTEGRITKVPRTLLKEGQGVPGAWASAGRQLPRAEAHQGLRGEAWIWPRGRKRRDPLAGPPAPAGWPAGRGCGWFSSGRGSACSRIRSEPAGGFCSLKRPRRSWGLGVGRPAAPPGRSAPGGTLDRRGLLFNILNFAPSRAAVPSRCPQLRGLVL